MGDRLFSWVDVEGTEWPLNGETNYQVIVGPQGMYGIPINIVTQEVPLQPGTLEKYVQLLPGVIKLPVLVYAADEPTFDFVRRQLKWAMSPSRGLGKIRHTANDGTVRELNCRLQKGFEGDETAGNRGLGAIILALEFFAADPFWYDTDFQQVPFATGSTVQFLGTTPFLPIQLSSIGAVGVGSVENDGDALAWPVWTLQGPASSLSLTNLTTGDALSLPSTQMATITAGQEIVIDTSPQLGKTIVREDGSKHFGYMNPTSILWGFAVGTNAVSVAVGGTGAATLLTLQYKRRYEGV